MQGFESVKDFSKENMPEERAAAAREIRRTRREYFEKKRSLKERLSSILEDAESKKAESSEVKNRLESTEKELDERSENMVKQLFYYRSINKVRENMETGRLTEERIEQELAD